MTYVITDLHGMYDFYPKIKEKLKPDDIVYCLGDCTDRGHSGWRLLKAIIDDPQFILLKGNHEDILLRAMRNNYSDYKLLKMNGGRITYFDCCEDEEKDKYLDIIEQLPLSAMVVFAKDERTFILSHAGFTPYDSEYAKISEENLLWDRYHCYDSKSPKKKYKDYIIVHGHTPIQYLIDGEMKFEPYYYFDNQKICLDTGAYSTGKLLLFCLDNMTYEVIEL